MGKRHKREQGWKAVRFAARKQPVSTLSDEEYRQVRERMEAERLARYAEIEAARLAKYGKAA